MNHLSSNNFVSASFFLYFSLISFSTAFTGNLQLQKWPKPSVYQNWPIILRNTSHMIIGLPICNLVSVDLRCLDELLHSLSVFKLIDMFLIPI